MTNQHTSLSVGRSGELLVLADRVEAAAGPDRDIDLAIWRLGDPRSEEIEASGRKPLDWLHCYTDSLNDAKTLVPKEAFWQVGHDGSGPDPSMFAARVFDPLTMKAPAQAVAETAGIALTAAALRAQATNNTISEETGR